MEKGIECITVNYANFSGRASRSEFWYFVLFCFVIGFSISLIGGILRMRELTDLLLGIFQLGIMIPNIAVTARRLHDHNKSGWWQLIGLVPILGGLYLLVLFCMRGTIGSNNYGNDPLIEL